MKTLSQSLRLGKTLQIFDLGNVLYKVDARLSMAALQALGMPPLDGPVSNSHAGGEVFGPYCDGKITTPEFLDGVRKMCQIPGANDDQIVEAWNAMLLGFCRESVMAVRQVRREGRLVVLLSNCNELHALKCRTEFEEMYPDLGSFDSLFDHVFFSQEIGMSKPDPRTWQLVLDTMGIRPADAVFYDDSPINIKAATELGIEGVEFNLSAQ